MNFQIPPQLLRKVQEFRNTKRLEWLFDTSMTVVLRSQCEALESASVKGKRNWHFNLRRWTQWIFEIFSSFFRRSVLTQSQISSACTVWKFDTRRSCRLKVKYCREASCRCIKQRFAIRNKKNPAVDCHGAGGNVINVDTQAPLGMMRGYMMSVMNIAEKKSRSVFNYAEIVEKAHSVHKSEAPLLVCGENDQANSLQNFVKIKITLVDYVTYVVVSVEIWLRLTMKENTIFYSLSSTLYKQLLGDLRCL